MTLGHHDRRLLAALDELGCQTAGQVTRACGYGGNIRSFAQLIRRELEDLCARGLALHLDDQKPTCWVRTVEGTRALEEAA